MISIKNIFLNKYFAPIYIVFLLLFIIVMKSLFPIDKTIVSIGNIYFWFTTFLSLVLSSFYFFKNVKRSLILSCLIYILLIIISLPICLLIHIGLVRTLYIRGVLHNYNLIWFTILYFNLIFITLSNLRVINGNESDSADL